MLLHLGVCKARFPTRKSKEFQKRPLKIPSFSEEMNDFQTCSVRKQLEVGSRGKDIESNRQGKRDRNRSGEDDDGKEKKEPHFHIIKLTKVVDETI